MVAEMAQNRRRWLGAEWASHKVRRWRRLLCCAAIVGALGLLVGIVAVALWRHDGDSTVPPIGHPRLFFNESELAVLRTRVETTHRDIWQPIRNYVDSLAGTAPPSASPDGNEDMYRNFGNQMVPLAFVCAVTQEADDCDLAKTYLLTFAKWEQWSNDGTRDLALGHMLMGNAIAYDWLYSVLTPDERLLVGTSLAHWANAMLEASEQPIRGDWNNWWNKSYAQNHYWINNSALGVAGLASLDDEMEIDVTCRVRASKDVNLRQGPGTDTEIVEVLGAGESVTVLGIGTVGSDGYVWWHTVEGLWVRSDVVGKPTDCTGTALGIYARKWLDQGLSRLSRVRDLLDAIGDGSWHEGATYQNYGLTLTLPFLVTLRSLTGIDLLPHTYLSHYADWRLYNYLPGRSEPLLAFGNFELDWGNSFAPQSLLRFAASEYDNGYAEWLAQQLIRNGGRGANVWQAPWYVFEFFYYDATIAPVSPADQAGARVFPDLEGVIWRTGWDEDDLVFGLKTGPYAGRFTFDSFMRQIYPWEAPCSQTWCQLNIGHDHDDTNGFYIYQSGWLAPEGVGSGLHATSYHNTLLIDGNGQYRPPATHYWRNPEDFTGSEGILEATADAPQFNFLAADATQRYKNVEGLSDVTRYVVFIRPNYLVMFDRVEADAPHQVDWVVHLESGASVDGAWIRSGGDSGPLLGIGFAAPQRLAATMGTDKVPYVRMRPESPSDSVLFASVLYPTDSSGWDSRPTITLADRTSEAAVLRLQPNDGSQQVIDVVLAFDQPQAPIEIGSYRFDGRVAVVVRGADNALQKLFMYGGTTLTDTTAGELTLIEGLDVSTVFEAIFTGSTASVTGSVSGEITLFAPEAQQVTLNGSPRSFTRSGQHIVF